MKRTHAQKLPDTVRPPAGTPEKVGGVQRRVLFNCAAPWSHAAGLSVGRVGGH